MLLQFLKGSLRKALGSLTISRFTLKYYTIYRYEHEILIKGAILKEILPNNIP